MQSTSALYKTIFADANHTVEWKITVNGNDYTGDKIAADAVRPRLPRKLFAGMQPAVGECLAAQFSCAIYEASSVVPRMATVVPAYRLVLGQDVSEWVTLGTFYIDTRSVDKASGALMLTCFDRMLVADGAGGKSYAELTGFSTWPQAQTAVANEIATIMGITVDARTGIGTGAGYMVDYPNDLSMREVLGYIGAANAGNWTITPENKLRLVPLTGGTDTLNVGAAAAGLRTAPALAAWSGVTVWYGDEEAYQAGDDTGRRLTLDCPWATQATANGILAAITGKAYQPYTADGAIIDLALELGDVVTAGLPNDTVSGPVFSIRISGSALEQADIEAPGEDEIDHEYPYVDYVDRSLKRKVTLGQSYYGTEISREKGLYISRSDGKSDVALNSDLMVFRGLVDGVMVDQIYFDPVSGRYIFNGSLGADAVFTNSLYAEQGDIAELTVDRINTSRRIRKYIMSDTSDDNYIDIQGQYERFITASYDSSASPDHVQASNRYGQLLYWQREPVSHDANGYPFDADGEQIYATTDVTDYPVYVYVYNEQIKAQLYFAQEDGTYVPMIVLGAGDEHGNTKGTLHKAADGFDINFVTSAGDVTGLKCWSAGYMDLYGLRKPTELDFSDWDSGTVSETLDGGVHNYWMITFQDGDPTKPPVKFTDAVGHETVVIW